MQTDGRGVEAAVTIAVNAWRQRMCPGASPALLVLGEKAHTCLVVLAQRQLLGGVSDMFSELERWEGMEVMVDDRDGFEWRVEVFG
jgi:hypothetical protein